MRPLHRKPVSKGASVGKFNGKSRTMKAPNIVRAPMRGGWRL